MVTKVTIITILIVSVVTLAAIPFVTQTYGLTGIAGGGTSTPIIIWADKDSYDKNETVTISGKVDRVDGSQITLEIREVDYQDFPVIISFEFQPNQDGSFERSFSTASLPKPGPYNVKAVYGNWEPDTQTAFTYTGVPGAPPITITIHTDKSVYRDGDTVHVSGTVSNLLEGFPITLSAIRPDGKVVTIQQFDVSNDRTFETELTAGGLLWDTNGIYTINVLYGTEASTAQTTIEFKKKTGQDLVPPLLLVPEDILVDATDIQGARVEYSVKSIDDVDGVLEPFCNPPSGYLFPIGDNKVTCQSFDSSGNNIKKSFTITVQNPATFVIPDWVKDVAGFWCNDEIDDSSFIEAIQYLIENRVILVPLSESGSGTTQIVPSWIKNNACWWSQGLISDDDFASGLEYLIQQGIIKV